MSRLDDVLNPDERLLFRTRLHWLACAPGALLVAALGALALAALVALASSARGPMADLFAQAPAVASILAVGLLLVIALPLLLVRFLVATHEFGVTNRRVVARMGWLGVRTVDLNVGKVESLVIEQSPAGRLFGYGDVQVVGTGGSAERFRGVRDPIGFRKAVNAAADGGHTGA